MKNTFITKIHINEVRHLKEIGIELSETELKHLILTGKNGSGKTSLLEAMRLAISQKQTPPITRHRSGKSIEAIDRKICILLSDSVIDFAKYMFAYIPARRSKLTIPKAIEPVQLQNKTLINKNVNEDFIKYILNLDYRLYGAQTDNDEALERNLSKWFLNFLEALRSIYNCNNLKLKRDTKNLTFNIEIPGRKTFTLSQMSDGYAAFLNIIMELLMRMGNDEDAVVDYEKSAIVLIDEIEAHLHVDLQKKVLPFLTKMFPNTQFIVATHSPFVMTSLDNAIVYDLEKNERLERPSFYSYDTVVESFLDTSMYSNELKKYFARYKELCLKENQTPEEKEEFLRAKAELEIRAIPSTELYIEFQNLENKRRSAKNGKND